MNLYDLLVDTADRAIEIQRSDGSMPPGHNGPYYDPETPVRNTAHWSITFVRLADNIGDDAYLAGARDALAYLQRDAVRPYGYTFHHRDVENKNRCNGLIGQAWTIEALAVGAAAFDAPALAALAEKVFLLHPFDEQLGLWTTVEIDGRPLGLDPTFNHQLWFAAAGGLLATLADVDDAIETAVTTFLDTVPATMGLYDSGLIRHGINVPPDVNRVTHLLRTDPRVVLMGLLSRTSLTDVQVLRDLVNHPVVPVRRPPLRAVAARRKAVGYHAFNQYAFALLAEAFPEHDLWVDPRFRRAYEYLFSDAYYRQIAHSPYGYPYNPPGFEVPYAIETFEPRPNRALQSRWLSSQLARCFDPDACEMSWCTEDPRTHTARLYQATRLPNLEVTLDQPVGL